MSRRTLGFLGAGLLVAALLAVAVSRVASSEPDGLERVAADHALDTGEEPHALAEGPFADYTTRGVDDPGTSTGVAGVVGVAAVFVVTGGLVWTARAVGGRRARPPAEAER